jgi:hypothetical protein
MKGLFQIIAKISMIFEREKNHQDHMPNIFFMRRACMYKK